VRRARFLAPARREYIHEVKYYSEAGNPVAHRTRYSEIRFRRVLCIYSYSNSSAPDRLDEFLNHYRKAKDGSSFHTVDVSAFVATPAHDRSFQLINSLRNNFIHFTRKR
jgi:hypothetical protein